jgi:hypothetical protein
MGYDQTAANRTNTTHYEKLRWAVPLETNALRRIQAKIYLAFCEKPDSYDTDAAPDDMRSDSVLDASVMCWFTLRSSQAKRHKGRQTAAAHQLQALVSVTRLRGFKRALPPCGAGLQSRLHKKRKSGATAVERDASSCGCRVHKRTSVVELRIRVRNCASHFLMRISCNKGCPDNKLRLDKRLQCYAPRSRTL